MFDTLHVSPVTRSVTEHVHEHRAPTDESIKLLHEFEKEAKSKFKDSIHLSDNLFDGKVLIEFNQLDMTFQFNIMCCLNGKRIDFDYIISEYEVQSIGISETFGRIKTKLANAIANNILNTSFAAADRDYAFNKLLKKGE